MLLYIIPLILGSLIPTIQVEQRIEVIVVPVWEADELAEPAWEKEIKGVEKKLQEIYKSGYHPERKTKKRTNLRDLQFGKGTPKELREALQEACKRGPTPGLPHFGNPMVKGFSTFVIFDFQLG